MATSADFKATVQSSLEQPGDSRLPRPGQILLLGTTTGGAWLRLRIPRRYRWFASLTVRWFVREKAIDRLAIVSADDPHEPRQVRVAFADRADIGDAGVSDPRLARLVAAAKGEWSPTPPRMFTVFGIPWPIAMLLIALSFELLTGVTRLMKGTWPADAPHFVYLALIAATAAMLGRQERVGYALALLLSAVQFVRPIVLYVPFIQSRGMSTVVIWLLWSWSEPALIWALLGLLYVERRRSSRV